MSGVQPLCVDLDGTLIRTDLLFESTLVLLKRNPLYLFVLPFWLLGGRAHVKRQIARRARVDIPTLPWDSRVLELLEAESHHRPLVLCTASDRVLAEAVAQHLGCFDRIIASDGSRNLSGHCKAAALVEAYGERGFDYAGNETRDLAIWRYARHAYIVNAAEALAARARKVSEVVQVLPRERKGMRRWFEALRLHQWLKNVLVLVPSLAAHKLLQPVAMAHAAAAFFIFGVCASGVYVLNDLLDLSADRTHLRKRARPFAAGYLPLAAGLVAAPLLTFAAFLAAYTLNPLFALVLLGYYVLTLAYSLRLKQIAMLDVLVLAALYTVRMIAGGVAVGIEVSFWLLAFSMFLFLSLAILKRYTELGTTRNNSVEQLHGRGYAVGDYELLASLGGASGYLSVLVLALYINSAASQTLYHRPQVLWILCPLLLYWVSRAWIIAHRGAMHDDPIVYAVSDNVSRIIILLCAVVMLCAI